MTARTARLLLALGALTARFALRAVGGALGTTHDNAGGGVGQTTLDLNVSFLAAAGIDVYIHAPYLVNVASTNNKIRIPSRKILAQHAEARAALAGAPGRARIRHRPAQA